MSKLVSVIVPVYNTEKYVQQCIKSILNQSYANIELLLVDDGSIDSSGSICDQYGIDRRVKIIHKENGGLSSARNCGIEKSKGDYIVFIDSDDYVDKKFIETLTYAIESSGAKIAMCRYTRKENDFCHKVSSKIRLYHKEEVLYRILYQKDQELFSVAMWNKIFSKEVFDNIRFPVGKLNEDMFVICDVFENSEKIAVIDYKGYFYRINPVSITQKNYSHGNMDVIYACDSIYDHVEKNYNDIKLLKAAINLKFRRSFQMVSKIWLSKEIEKYTSDEKILKDFLLSNKRTIIFDLNSRLSSKMVALLLYFGIGLVKQAVVTTSKMK